jgi:hypothetical protein
MSVESAFKPTAGLGINLLSYSPSVSSEPDIFSV